MDVVNKYFGKPFTVNKPSLAVDFREKVEDNFSLNDVINSAKTAVTPTETFSVFLSIVINTIDYYQMTGNKDAACTIFDAGIPAICGFLRRVLKATDEITV